MCVCVLLADLKICTWNCTCQEYQNYSWGSILFVSQLSIQIQTFLSKTSYFYDTISTDDWRKQIASVWEHGTEHNI
jgi:hypothetical protein